MKINLKQLLLITAIAAVVCFCLRRPALWLCSGSEAAQYVLVPWQHWALAFGYEVAYPDCSPGEVEFEFFFPSLIASIAAHAIAAIFTCVGIGKLWVKLGSPPA